MMRAGPAELGAVLTTSHAVRCRVSAWRGGTLLADDVPVLDGQLTEAADQAVPERVTLRVPATDPATGLVWAPADPLDPLAPYGQRVRVVRSVIRADGTELAVPLGWFRIESWELDAGVVTVDALGLLAVLAQARLLAPTAPPSGATFASELRRLVDGLLPVLVDPALVNRAVPSGFAWTDDRLGAVLDVVAAWPARAWVDAAGTLRVAPPPADATDPPELEWSHGDPGAGTVVDALDAGDRDGVANVVVARGEGDDGTRPPVLGYAWDTDPASAANALGPYGPAPLFYASPLLTTTEQAAAAARTRLATSRRRVHRLRVTTVPDPRACAADGTRVDVVDVDGVRRRTRVLTATLPLTAAGGAATYDVGVLT